MKDGALMSAAGGETMAAIAHDLRTPMCCVSGAAQMALQASRQGKDVDEQLRQILQAVEVMDRMLGQMCGHDRESICTAAKLEQELCTVMLPRAAQKAQQLVVDFSELCAPCGFNEYLTRVLLNLISNAIKYTQAGGRIDVTAKEEDGQVVFVVSDNGMGMKREFMRRMYLPYERAQESAHLPGKGVGLSIVRRLVRRMGGTISVKSAWGKGTTFTVRVPLERNRLQ